MDKNAELNRTMQLIMDYLAEELADGDKYISYEEIGRNVHRGRHSVGYSIKKLQRMGKIDIIDKKLSLVDAE